MLCPECNHPLSPFTFKTDIQDVIVDYCDHCAGIWTDQGEVNFIKEKNLSPLLDLLPPNPVKVVARDRLCPKDRSILSLYQSESVPLDVEVYRCPKCSGNFFPFSNLERFKRAQEVKLNYFKIWNIPLHSIYAILLPVVVFLLLAGGMLTTIIGVQQSLDVRSRAADMISQPLLIRRSENEVFISFTTTKPFSSKIKYWHQEDTMTEAWISPNIDTIHTIILYGLEPKTGYHYQIILVEPQEVVSEIYSFSTK